MTLSGTANVRNLTLTLSGRHPASGRVEFSDALEIDAGGVTYRAPRSFRADEPVQLHFSVDFRPGKSLDATALVSGFRASISSCLRPRRSRRISITSIRPSGTAT